MQLTSRVSNNIRPLLHTVASDHNFTSQDEMNDTKTDRKS